MAEGEAGEKHADYIYIGDVKILYYRSIIKLIRK